MNSRISRLAIVFLVVVGLLGAWTAQGRSSSRTAWEYAAFSDRDFYKKDLNSLGAEGWELVAILPAMTDGNTNPGSVFYFKRAR